LVTPLVKDDAFLARLSDDEFVARLKDDAFLARLKDDAFLARIEEAGLNASATSRQMLYDGWLMRSSPGKAQRARCINAIAPARLPLSKKLAFATAHYAARELPLIFRITPFSEPSNLDAELAARGFAQLDDTRVMVGDLEVAPRVAPLMQYATLEACDAVHFAETVGQLRGTSAPARAAHAKRLAEAPDHALRVAITLDNEPVAAGQCILEDGLAGLYDIITAPQMRGKGLGSTVISWLLKLAHAQGARATYLQVESSNTAARSLYAALGMSDRYAYHYRIPPT
jgi:ribosomal protein S18 acetylase RimI-like enzyme